MKRLIFLTIAFAIAMSACAKSNPKPDCCILLIRHDGADMTCRITNNKQPKSQGWSPGRLVLFREAATISKSTMHIPDFPSDLTVRGQAGEIYQIDLKLQLQRLRTFDLRQSDNELLDQHAGKCN
jgi:hypothetical protein